MKTRYLQNYQNECGLYAIKNLLYFYKIKAQDVEQYLHFDTNGTNLKSMKETLLHYFEKVEVIQVSLEQIKSIDQFQPQIILIVQQQISHYVVLYKINKKYAYLVDSLYKKSYRVRLEELKKVYTQKMIVCERTKEVKKRAYSFLLFTPLLHILETIFLLSSTVLLQQLIDQNLADGMLYGAIQLFLLCVIAIKIKLYLKMFSLLDQDLVMVTTKRLFHVQEDYIKKYPRHEIFYRLWDSYQLKGMYLAFFFSLSPDVFLALCILILLCIYQVKLTLWIVVFLIPAILLSVKIFYKMRVLIEKRRIKESELLNAYQNALKSAINENDSEKELLRCLKNFQQEDYLIEKLTHQKNQLLMYFQTILISFLILCYFCNWFSFKSIGSLIAMINMVSLLLQPILNICSTITIFSNKTLICQRLKDLKKHQR